MIENPWIPVDEILPEPYQIVIVWTDYAPFGRYLPPRRQNLSFTMTEGFVDIDLHWNMRCLGQLDTFNFKQLYQEPGHGLLGHVNVLFWMPLPPPPPGQKFPKLYQRFDGREMHTSPQIAAAEAAT